jgi:(p)ppGpp synthase/HD superfamily hydrolase
MYNLKIITADEFAKKAHGNQKYGELDYSFHLNGVAKVYREFKDIILDGNYMLDGIFLSACWLHDVIEDTSVTYKEVKEIYGSVIAGLVYAVTDEDGETRKERKKKTLPKTRNHGRLAVALKLCDRIANVENCISTNNTKLLSMYKKEHDMFRDYLYCEEDNLDKMWNTLDCMLG